MRRLPIADILHRGIVTSLFGLTLYGIFLGVTIHRETLQKGRGQWSRLFLYLLRTANVFL